MFCSWQQMGFVAMAEDSHSDGYLICSIRATTFPIAIRFVQHPNKSWHKFKNMWLIWILRASLPWNTLHIVAPCSFSGSLPPWTSRVLVAPCLCQRPRAFRAIRFIRCDELAKTRADLATRFGSPPTLWQGEHVLPLVWLQNSLHFMNLHDRDCHDWHNRFNASLVFLLQVPVCLGYRAAMGCRSSATPVLSGCRPSRRVDARLWDLCRGKAVWVTRRIHRSWFPESSRSGVDSTSKLSNRKIHLDDYQGILKENVRCCELANWGGFTVLWSHFFCWPKLRKLGIEHVPAVLFMPGFKYYPGRIEIHVEGLVSFAFPWHSLRTLWGCQFAQPVKSQMLRLPRDVHSKGFTQLERWEVAGNVDVWLKQPGGWKPIDFYHFSGTIIWYHLIHFSWY